MLHFLCIGAQKCGTSWLYFNLSRHPDISFPGGREIHFWDNRQQRELVAYKRLFDVPDGRLHGDSTPAYAIIPPEVIAECHQEFPRLRLIYIMRNPIDRAISHAKMRAHLDGLDPQNLPSPWFVQQFHSYASLARGDYETCIRNWRTVYPEESLLLLFYEDLMAAPLKLLARCCRHLGLKDVYKNDASNDEELVINSGPTLDINPEWLAVLHEMYEDKIASLARYLGCDLSAWTTPKN